MRGIIEIIKCTPILKGKSGEARAIRNLSQQTLDRTFLIIEVPPIPTKFHEDEAGVPIGKLRTLHDHLDHFIRNFVDQMPQGMNFGVDFSHIESGRRVAGTSCVEYVFSKCLANGLAPVPVVGPQSGFAHEAEIYDLLKNNRFGAVVRVPRRLCGFPTAISNGITAFANTVQREFSEFSLIFDYGSITRGDREELIAECNQLEAELPIDEYRFASVVATSMPNSVTLDMKAFSTEDIPRLEWEVWKQADLSKLGFGDYGVTTPEYLDEDFRLITLGGKIRYTTPDSWLIVKGKKLEKNGKQFHRLAQILQANKSCKSPKYSWGDSRIRACAEVATGPGNLATWLAFTTNHHITMVARQLASAA